MIDDIRKRLPELEAICRTFRVKSLDLFGSAAQGRFDPKHSDLDFLVEFQPLASGEHADAYFGVLHGLEDLFARKIDLVMPQAIRNRYFQEAVQRDRQRIYGA